MKHRPSPALVLAVLALVVAMAGTSYAATQIGSAQIKNNSVKGKDVKDANLTGKDVKDKSLTGADIQDGSLTAADLPAPTPRTCPATTFTVQGVCIDKTATGPGTYTAALANCDTRNGRLMSYAESRTLVTRSGLTWANGQQNLYEFTSEVVNGGSTFDPLSTDFAGHPFAVIDVPNTDHYHRCVTYP
jgi:hypothetical protein